MFKIETKKTKLKDKCTSCVPQFFPQKKKKMAQLGHVQKCPTQL